MGLDTSAFNGYNNPVQVDEDLAEVEDLLERVAHLHDFDDSFLLSLKDWLEQDKPLTDNQRTALINVSEGLEMCGWDE